MPLSSPERCSSTEGQAKPERDTVEIMCNLGTALSLLARFFYRSILLGPATPASAQGEMCWAPGAGH